MSNFTATITTKTTERPPRPPRTLIYTKHGIGKTTFLAQAANPIGCRTERGLEKFDIPQFPECKQWSDIFACFDAIAKSTVRYDTLLFDTFDHAVQMAATEIIATDFKGDITEFEHFGRGYKNVFQNVRVLLGWFEYFNNEMGMQILISCHATVKNFKNPSGTDYDKYQPNLPDSTNTNICNLLQEWCDIVLFAKEPETVDKLSKKDKSGKAHTIGNRTIYSKPQAAWDSKVGCGFQLPDTFDLDYRIYEQYIFGGQPIPEINETETN